MVLHMYYKVCNLITCIVMLICKEKLPQDPDSNIKSYQWASIIESWNKFIVPR
jgi:hypothetical protein